MKKKLIAYTLLTLIVIAGINYESIFKSHADGIIQPQYQLDIGYWDCWKYSDGVTWQDKKPGDTVTHKVTVAYDGAGTVKGVKGVTFFGNDEAKYNLTSKPNVLSYSDYLDNIYPYAVNNAQNISYKYLGNQKVEFTITTKLTDWSGQKGENIKKWWQSTQVEGRRFYIPVLIEWEIEPLVSRIHYTERHFLLDFEKGKFYDAADSVRLEKPIDYTYKGMHKNFKDAGEYLAVEGDNQAKDYIRNRLEPAGYMLYFSNEDMFTIDPDERLNEASGIQSVELNSNTAEIQEIMQQGKEPHVLIAFYYKLNDKIAGEPYVTMTNSVDPNPSTLVNGTANANLIIDAEAHNMRTGEGILYWEIFYKKREDAEYQTIRVDSTSTRIHREIGVTIDKDTTFDIQVKALTDYEGVTVEFVNQ